MDWVPSWRNINGYGGIPPGGSDGVSTVFNWLLAYVLKLAAKLEEHFGDASIARRYTGNAENLSVRLTRFMDAERGLYADDDSGGEFSEHAQIMAILAGAPNSGRIFSAMLKNPDVKRVSLFFTHYLFECAKLLEANALFHERLSPWFDALHMGFRTFPETFENSRSDCHGWGAMPLYHLISTVCGIRPAGFGFKNIEIAPLPDALGKLRSASCPHPAGKIRITAAGGELTVSLPKGTDGCFRYGGINMKLHPGTQQITIKEMKG
jgi:hypothetical protein